MSAEKLFVVLESGGQGEQVLYLRKINHALRNATAANVEEIAETIASHENLTCILIDEPLHDDKSESITTAIISNHRITRLSIFHVTEASMPLLRRLFREMTSLRRVVLPYRMPIAYADEIFSALHTVTMLKELHVVFSRNDESFEGSAIALNRYFRETSSLTTLGFSFWTWNISLQSAFSCICEAIGDCSSLRCLMIKQRFPSADETAVELVGMAELFAPAMLKSLLLKEFRFSGTNTVMMDKICDTLESTTAVKNFDLTFCQVDNELLKLSRKWKPLLGDNLPLSNWPEILSEADDWVEKSQSPYTTDVHYFLVREMCPLLLHNLPQNDEMIAGRLEFTSGAESNVHGVSSTCCGVM